MNLLTTIQASKKASKKNTLEKNCENISSTLSTFNVFLANIYNKLELSNSIYRK